MPTSVTAAVAFGLLIVPGFLAVSGFGAARAQSTPERDLYAVAQATISKVQLTCPRTARPVFWGGCFKLHGCWLSLLQQCSIRLRSASASKGCKGWSTAALVRKTVFPAAKGK